MTVATKVAGTVRKTCIAFLALATAGCRPTAREVTVLFAADQAGYLAPCGCSQHQLGGAARAVTAVHSLADGGAALFVQGGNLMSDALSVAEDKLSQDRAKAAALVQSWKLAATGLAAVWGVGPFDAALGPETQRQLMGDLPLLLEPKIVEVNGVKIGLLPITASQAGGPPASGAVASSGLRAQGARLVIGVVQAPLGQAAGLAAAAGADLALQAGIVDPVQDTDEAAQLSQTPPTFRVKDKGRGLLALRFHLPQSATGVAVIEGPEAREARAAELEKVLASNRARLAEQPDGGPLRDLLQSKIAQAEQRKAELLSEPAAPAADKISVTYQFIDLTESVPEDPAAAALFSGYTADLQRANLAAQANRTCPSPKPGQAHYVGASACQECHADAYTTYQATHHVNAYATLVAKRREYDLDCVGCHVVGYGQPGGQCRLDRVAAYDRGGLGGVQCESCHGMGSAHADSAGEVAMPVAAPGYDTCYQCHDPKNDNRFNRETYVSFYLPAILGPGHRQRRR